MTQDSVVTFAIRPDADQNQARKLLDTARHYFSHSDPVDSADEKQFSYVERYGNPETLKFCQRVLVKKIITLDIEAMHKQNRLPSPPAYPTAVKTPYGNFTVAFQFAKNEGEGYGRRDYYDYQLFHDDELIFFGDESNERQINLPAGAPADRVLRDVMGWMSVNRDDGVDDDFFKNFSPRQLWFLDSVASNDLQSIGQDLEEGKLEWEGGILIEVPQDDDDENMLDVNHKSDHSPSLG